MATLDVGPSKLDLTGLVVGRPHTLKLTMTDSAGAYTPSSMALTAFDDAGEDLAVITPTITTGVAIFGLSEVTALINSATAVPFELIADSVSWFKGTMEVRPADDGHGSRGNTVTTKAINVSNGVGSVAVSVVASGPAGADGGGSIWIDVADYGVAPGNTGTVNMTGVQAAITALNAAPTTWERILFFGESVTLTGGTASGALSIGTSTRVITGHGVTISWQCDQTLSDQSLFRLSGTGVTVGSALDEFRLTVTQGPATGTAGVFLLATVGSATLHGLTMPRARFSGGMTAATTPNLVWMRTTGTASQGITFGDVIVSGFSGGADLLAASRVRGHIRFRQIFGGGAGGPGHVCIRATGADCDLTGTFDTIAAHGIVVAQNSSVVGAKFRNMALPPSNVTVYGVWHNGGVGTGIGGHGGKVTGCVFDNGGTITAGSAPSAPNLTAIAAFPDGFPFTTATSSPDGSVDIVGNTVRGGFSYAVYTMFDGVGADNSFAAGTEQGDTGYRFGGRIIRVSDNVANIRGGWYEGMVLYPQPGTTGASATCIGNIVTVTGTPSGDGPEGIRLLGFDKGSTVDGNVIVGTVRPAVQLFGMVGCYVAGNVGRTTIAAGGTAAVTTDAYCSGCVVGSNLWSGYASVLADAAGGANIVETGAVTSVAGRTGAITLAVTDVSGAASSTDLAATTSTANGAATLAGAHASRHAAAGADPLSLAASQITSGTIATARLGSGSPTGSTVLLGDQTWGAVPNIAASQITSGTVATARLGSGSPTSSTVLRGDQTWGAVPDISGSQVTSGTIAPARLGTAIAAPTSIWEMDSLPTGSALHFPISSSTWVAGARVDGEEFWTGCEIANPFLASGIAINVTTGVAASITRISLYNSAAGLPTTLIEDLGTVDCSTTGIKTVNFATPRTLGGEYWVRTHTTGTAALVVVNGTSPSGAGVPHGGPFSGYSTAQPSGWRRSGATAGAASTAAPSTAPSLTVTARWTTVVAIIAA